MLNSEKMSKSTGNFRTLRQAIDEFSSDATRFSLADAGDGMDDANFMFDTANAAILRLTKEITWMEDVIMEVSKITQSSSGSAESSSKPAEISLRFNTPSTYTYADKVFANEINIAVKSCKQSYDDFLFKEALKAGFYDLQAARDEYRLSCGSRGMNKDSESGEMNKECESGGMNVHLLWKFMEIQTKLITPICPHYAEHVWKILLRKEGFVVNSGFPEADPPDLTLQRANKYLQDSIVSMRKLLQKQVLGSKKPKKNAPVLSAEENKLTVGLIYVNEQYGGWQEECLKILKSKYIYSDERTFASDNEIIEALKRSSIGQEANFKQIQKLCMPFFKFKKDEALSVGPQALGLKLPFGEMDVLTENIDLIKRQLGLDHVEILNALDPKARKRAGPNASLLDQNPPSPGKPISIFLSMSSFTSIQP